MKRRTIAAVAAALTLAAIFAGGIAVAASNDVSASCTPSPPVDDTGTSLRFSVECTLPKPAAVTETVTVPGPTVTVTATPGGGSTGDPTDDPTGTTDPTDDPTVDPTDDPTGEPTDPPVPSGFPDETTTGVPAGTTLKRVPEDVTSGPGWRYDPRGWVIISGDGAVFSGYRVTTSIDVTADNVVVRGNLLELGGRSWGITLRHTRGVVIDHNTIRGQSFTNPCGDGIRGIYGDDDTVTITANEISSCLSGINHLNAGGVIADNYIHAMGSDAGGAHINGIQLGAGSGPAMVIRHNTIFNEHAQTDAIMLANDDGAQRNRVITGNLLGGGGYTFYGSGAVAGVATGIVISNNQFTTRFFPRGGYWGPVAYWKTGNGNVWASNTWADGPNAGKAINP